MIPKNASENVIGDMAAILSRGDELMEDPTSGRTVFILKQAHRVYDIPSNL